MRWRRRIPTSRPPRSSCRIASDRDRILGAALAEVGDEYPYVLVDCPPSLGMLTINALAAANRLIVPVQCEYYALEGLAQLLETVELIRAEVNPRLSLTGLLLTMHDGRTRLSADVAREVRSHFGPKVFTSVIPRNVRIAEAPSHGRPISTYDPRSPAPRRTTASRSRWSSVASPGARGLGRGLVAMLDPSDGGAAVRAAAGRPRRPEPAPAAALASTSRRSRALTRSIAADGVVQPVVVRERPDGRYELIAGERRWRAAMAAGLTTIPAVVRNAPDRDALLLAIVENVVREDLNAVEIARGYAALADGYGLTVLEIAERVGRSRSGVSNILRLLELPDDVLELISDGRLSEGHGRAILQIEDADGRRALARRAAAAGLSVRQTEALARRAGAARARRPVTQAWVDDDAIGEVVDAAYRAFGVPAKRDGRAGRLPRRAGRPVRERAGGVRRAARRGRRAGRDAHPALSPGLAPRRRRASRADHDVPVGLAAVARRSRRRRGP